MAGVPRRTGGGFSGQTVWWRRVSLPPPLSATQSTRRVDRGDFLIVAMLPVACGFSILAPQGLTWFPWVSVAIVLLIVARSGSRRHPWAGLSHSRRLLWWLGAFALWTLLRAIAAFNVADAFVSAGSFFFTVAGVILLIPLAAAISRDGRWFWLFFPIVNLVFVLAASLTANHVVSLGWISTRLGEAWHFNRAAGLAALLLPVSLYAVAQSSWSRSLKGLAMVVVAGAAGAGVWATYSESAKLALLAVLVVHGLGLLWPGLASRFVCWGFILALVLSPLLLPYAYDWTMQTHLLDGETLTFRPRLEIWRGTLGLISEAPLVGHGVEYMRNAGYIHPVTGLRTFDTHPHSAIFHMWVDLGFVGIVLFSVVLFRLGEMIRALPREEGAMICAIFGGTLAYWGVSHGMWQSWFVGLAGLAAFYALVAARRGAAGLRRSEP